MCPISRDEFREAVFERDHHQCVVCKAPAVDAHHLIERRLWSDGGYHIDNGVSLCAEDHLRAEETRISPQELREAAGIKVTLLPDSFDDEAIYDKWGNVCWPDGSRSPGPLFKDESVQKVLGPSGALHLFRHHFKHARTPHLPWSPNAGSDSDKTKDVFGDLGELYLDIGDVVVTQKMDGEQISLYPDHYHARSIDSGYHSSRTWIGNLHGKVAHEIPNGWRVVGENLYAQHSIRYENLPSYFMVFAIFNEDNQALRWSDMKDWAAMLGLETVPLLYRGPYDRAALEANKDFWQSPFGEAEGYVVRTAYEIDYYHWDWYVGKVVRADHVTTDQHWRHRPVKVNGLA